MSEILLKVDNLDKSFGGIHAVNHVSFEVEKGEILGLIGPNGSGKSTTVNLVAGTIAPDSGEILFEGKSLLKLGIAERASIGVCRTFQTPKAFTGLTTYQSVYTLALQRHSFEEAQVVTEKILQEFGLWEAREVFSQKLPIEKRKQLDMARIMAIDPKIIMLDEVMAGLNPIEMQECIDLVKRINASGVTILFIEHVMKAVSSLCSRCIVLADGSLLSEGAPEVVLNEPKVVEAYLGKGR